MLYQYVEPRRLNMFTSFMASVVIDAKSWLELTFVPEQNSLALNINTHHVNGGVDFYKATGLYFIIRVLVNNSKYNLALGRFKLYQAHKDVLEHILKCMYTSDELLTLANGYHCLANGKVLYLDLANCLFSDEGEDLP